VNGRQIPGFLPLGWSFCIVPILVVVTTGLRVVYPGRV
jgi:hypothetical protein